MLVNTLAFLLILATVYSKNNTYSYKTEWFQVPLDHFSFARNETFKIKYLVNDDNWDTAKGPIFFYTGNEGQIELFAKNTGFMWDIAAEFQAKLVFAEHRYYGASMPFGNKSLDNDHIGYLSSQQALADYADLINHLQGNAVKPQYPVIVFGGSYGGMLAAYFRMKYPHLSCGAIAASAPVHMFTSMVQCGTFHSIVTKTFNQASEHCVNNIRQSWKPIRDMAKTANGSEWFKTNWKLCPPGVNSTTIDTLVDFLENMYITLAMVDYPFPSDFLVPLPGNPVNYVCQYLNTTLSGEQLLEGIGKVLQVFSNYNSNKTCVEYIEGEDYGNLDASGWSFQACVEMVMPMCTNGIDDMFEVEPWNFTNYSEDCYKKYNVYPKENIARIEYGGNQLHGASNIVFSNGLLDPWAAGGVINNIGDSVVAVVIPDGAHHLDLMASNTADPPTVRGARDFHKQNIHKWINEFWVRSAKGLQKNRT